MVSNLQENSDENLVNTFIYCTRDEADNILRGLLLADMDRTNYSAVKAGFDAHVVGKRNMIYDGENGFILICESRRKIKLWIHL